MKSAKVSYISPNSENELQSFLLFDRNFMNSMPHYIPDLDADLLANFSGKSKQFSEMQFQLFMVDDGGQPIARCCAIINHRYQNAKKASVGSIGYFAALPGYQEQVCELIKAAEDWLADRGVTEVLAPFNGSALLGVGLMSSYYDEEPMYPFKWQPGYYYNYFAMNGYQVVQNLLFYTIHFSSPEYLKTKELSAPSGLRIRPLDKDHWDDDVEVFKELFNQCFKNEWQFHPYTLEEFLDFFEPMKQLLDMRQILIAEVDYKPVGIVMGLPDLNPALRMAKGKMNGSSAETLAKNAVNFKRAGIIAVGVLPEYRGMKIAKLLVSNVFQFYESKGLKSAFYYPVNLCNYESRLFAQSMGGIGKEMFHCLSKQIGEMS